MTGRRFREPGAPLPAEPPASYPLPPRANYPPRTPRPRETKRLAILALLAEDEAKGGVQKS